jgi:DNA-binding transcriptional ArsR family regulator
MVGERSGEQSHYDPLGNIESGRVAELFGLLSEQSRAGILYALLKAGELSTEQLTEWTGVPHPRVQEALRVLRAARVVSSRRAGEAVIYGLRGDQIRKLLEVAGAAGEARKLWQLRGVAAGTPTA